jgi:DNA replication protein DnaD
MQGWVSVHRKVMNNPVWQNPNLLKLWMYCLFKASHAEHKTLVGNQSIKLQRGQFVTGRNALSEDLNKGVKPDLMLSGKTWERYMKNLEKWKMLSIKVTNKYSLVTIVNYEHYQGGSRGFVQQHDHQLSSSCPATVQQLSTNNNGINVFNGYKKEMKNDLRLVKESSLTALNQYALKRNLVIGGTKDENK